MAAQRLEALRYVCKVVGRNVTPLEMIYQEMFKILGEHGHLT
ncbi:hypothetical protein LMG24235_05097 [Paraburkholderia sabiae]|nr:hypothetical protein LMG24235_05097 [Paraburkholderia sabiae]